MGRRRQNIESEPSPLQQSVRLDDDQIKKLMIAQVSAGILSSHRYNKLELEHIAEMAIECVNIILEKEENV